MEPGQSRLCPRCGTPRIGNFRWCRSCQYDFDAPTAPTETVQRPFALTPPGQITQAPHIIPADTPAPAPGHAPMPTAAAGPAVQAPPARERRPVPPLVIVAVVAVFSLVAIGLVAVVLPQSSPIAALPAGSSPSAAAGSSAGPAQSSSPSRTPAGDTTITGRGPGTAEFPFADSTGLARITNEGTGAFGVWVVGPDGSRQAHIVDRDGAYAGTRRFAAADGSVTFDVESDGAWSIEVMPFLHARTWNRASPLIGDGDDVVLLFPQPDGGVRMTVVSDGAIGVAAYAGGSKQDLVNEDGSFRGDIVLPAGTSLVEISAAAGWSIRPE
jgi:hypothetical protein